MKTDYVTTVETRLRWLRSAQDWQAWKSFHENAPMENIVQTQRAYIHVLEAGDTYFMSRKFCNMVDLARRTVPDDLVFESTWPQSPVGWLWLEDPAELPNHVFAQQSANDVLNNDLRLRAIGWIRAESGYAILCFTEQKHEKGFVPWSYFMLHDGEKMLERTKELEKNFSARPSGAMQGTYVMNREGEILHELRWAYVAFYLMAQKLSHHARTEPDRATRRRFEHLKPPQEPPIVRVVTLRKEEQDRERQKTAGGTVDWQWQWTVTGFWRNQPTKEGYKVIWIDDYIKGPPDKPLKPPGHKLFIAKR